MGKAGPCSSELGYKTPLLQTSDRDEVIQFSIRRLQIHQGDDGYFVQGRVEALTPNNLGWE